MKQLFRSQFKITQAFGVNYDYYKKFGLKGHEGIDLVPTGTVWDVLCLVDGVVVTDVDNPLSGAYGVYVTIWHPKLRKATQYCHFKENYVKNGDVVTVGQKLGLMGKTGNTTGAHVHLNLYDVDDNGVRLNKTNGFNGGIDPLPFLQEDAPIENTTLQKELDTCRVDRDTNHNDRIALYEELGFNGVFNLTVSVEKIRQLLAIEKSYVEKEGQLQTANSKIGVLEVRVKETEEKLTQFAAESTKTIQTLTGENQRLSIDITELKKAVTAPVRKGWKAFLVGLVDKL